jgi:adenylate kinase
MIISLIGVSGSGKGTQAEMLKDNFLSISGGRILRDMYLQSSQEGIDLYNNYWGKGEWVPDNIISKLVLSKVNFQIENILFDAFPRTLAQAITLDNFLKDNGRDLSYVFEFNIKKEIVLERIKNREKTELRSDDKSFSTIQKRILSYYDNISMIRDYYKERLVLIDASNSKEVIFRNILSIINNET